MKTFAAAVLAVLMASTSMASAQSRCGDRATILKNLQANAGEVLTGQGLSDGGQLTELIVAPDGSWTVLMTVPGMPTCMVATGQAWAATPKIVPERDS